MLSYNYKYEMQKCITRNVNVHQMSFFLISVHSIEIGELTEIKVNRHDERNEILWKFLKDSENNTFYSTYLPKVMPISTLSFVNSHEQTSIKK